MVLLLSALNGIVLISAGVGLFSALATGPDLSQLAMLQTTIEELTSLHRAALGGEHSDPEAIGAEVETLDLLETRVRGMSAPSVAAVDHAADALWEYRQTLGRWRVAGADVEAAGPLNGAYYKAVGALDAPLREGPTRLLDRSTNTLALVMIWVVLVSLTTIYAAFRLRRVLSEPLREMASAAARIAGGDLEHPFPDPGDALELQEVAGAVEGMRRNLVDALSAQEAQNVVMKAMLDSLSDGVLFLDDNGRVVRHNPRATEILSQIGVPRGALQAGVDARRLLPGADAGLLTTTTTEPAPLTFDRPGQRTHLELNVNRVVRLGESSPQAWVVALRDVTTAVEAEQIKRDFLSVVTHELKTPLTVIEGYIRLLLMGKGGDLTAKQAELLGRARDQSQLLTLMVQDLLDTTRLEGGNLPLELAPADLRRCVAEVRGQFMADALSRRLALVFDGEGVDEPLMVAIDAFRMKQILSNLIRNAFKFTPSGGSVTLDVGRDGDEVWASVADTGRGIPEHARPHLFEKFYQVERGDTRNAGGAGLGLYICDQLTRMMNGRIAVESRDGEGSRFILRFPHRPPEESGTP